MKNKDLWGGSDRVRYKTPASRLWVDGELRKLTARIDALKNQNTRLVERINMVICARRRYDTVTVARRKAKEVARARVYQQVRTLWAAHERARAESAPIGLDADAPVWEVGIPAGAGASPDSKKPA